MLTDNEKTSAATVANEMIRLQNDLSWDTTPYNSELTEVVRQLRSAQSTSQLRDIASALSSLLDDWQHATQLQISTAGILDYYARELWLITLDEYGADYADDDIPSVVESRSFRWIDSNN